ncbi:(2Fe-2S)-binding protein [Streptomyces sp. NPDC006339]|uniref:(2Fe-2S)-binding protein n=1 Tax=Streptomyces sp. NPDC006339 TaxID=3156755 RepID=UPI0033B7039E
MPLSTDPVAPVAPAWSCSVPLAGVYRRLAEVSPLVKLGVGRGPGAAAGWIEGHRLGQGPDGVESLVVAEERRIEAAYGVAPRRDVAATWALHRYAFTACLAMSGPWYLEQRVPKVALDGVAYHWKERELAVEAEAMVCLPGDPLAGRPGVRTVGGAEELRAELRDAVAAHLAPVLEAFRPYVRRRPHALWGMATDQLAGGVWHVGRALGDATAATRAADALLPGNTPPFTGAAGFRPSCDPGGEPTRTRTGCCLYYTIRPDDLCATCPRAR